MDERAFEETVTLARRLVRIPSHNPPGNENAMAVFVVEWLRDHGVTAQLVPLEPGRSSVVARVAGSEPGAIVLCGHLDTVTASPDAWIDPPLSGEIADGRLRGLGAADMKSGVAVLMQIAARWSAGQPAPRHDVVLALTADEEVAYRGAASIALSGLLDDAVCVVIAEPTSNVPHLGQKGELWIRAEFVGQEAHGSSPDRGVNSILPAARFAVRMDEQIRSLPEVPGAGKTSVNVGQIHGGRQVNIVPERTSVDVDVRCASEAHRDVVLSWVSRIGREEADTSRCTFTFHSTNDHRPIVSDRDHPEAQRLLATAKRLGTAPDEPTIVRYSTDGVSIHPVLDVPILVCGPGDIAFAHRPNESIALSEIRTALALFDDYLQP